MKKRDMYLSQLQKFTGKQLVKVITGVRRCGKSMLLDLFEEKLLNSGTERKSIVKMNFESFEFDHIRDYKELYAHVSKLLNPDGMTYLLLDEIQNVEEWERAVNSLRLDRKIDIYITGSNAGLLSSELSTLLSGRYVEVKMLPLSFKEYLEFNDYPLTGDLRQYFNEYLLFGGFPGITELQKHQSSVSPLLGGIYSTIVMKDIVQRGGVRDPALLDSLTRFMSSNVGNITSTKSICDYLNSSGRKTTADTIDNYLQLLGSAYVLYPVRRYDLKGKLHLKTHGKFYIVDSGIRNELLGFRNQDYGSMLENTVYFELLRRGCDVSIGKIASYEVDFVAQKQDSIMYIQVSASMLSDETRIRELRPLESIKDNYEKIVLSMDRTPVSDYNGIKQVNLLDFLLGG